MGATVASPTCFKFTPGQYIEMTLLKPPESDVEGDSRVLSIASAGLSLATSQYANAGRSHDGNSSGDESGYWRSWNRTSLDS